MTALRNRIASESHPVKIVLVEDNAEVAGWIKNKIDDFGNLALAGISNTYNGAFEMIKNEEPQLVILDLRLPDGNGLDILKKIRKARLNIIVMILSLNIQTKNVCLRMGADYFFDKNKGTDVLIEKLKYFNG